MNQYRCETCHDTGFVAICESQRLLPVNAIELVGTTFTVRPCDCSKQDRLQKLFKSSHITNGFLDRGFRNFSVQNRPRSVIEAKQTAEEYLNRFQDIRNTRENSIALLGEPGTGKTHLLMAVANNLMRGGVQVHYFPWVEGCDDLRSNMNELDHKLQVMKDVDVLYIDDLFKGREDPTNFEFKKMFGVINYRNMNYKPVLVSSELSVNDIRRVDEAFGSRIFEMVRNYCVEVYATKDELARGIEANYRML